MKCEEIVVNLSPLVIKKSKSEDLVSRLGSPFTGYQFSDLTAFLKSNFVIYSMGIIIWISGLLHKFFVKIKWESERLNVKKKVEKYLYKY